MIEIRELEPTKKNLRKFTQFQIDLYEGNPYYVPPLVSDDVQTLSPALNPAFEFCEQVLFMAFRDGKPVGRIAGIINHQVNDNTREKNARFGFIDFVDDHEVSAALMDAVEKWARRKGMNKLIGPLGFTDLDHEGMLVAGFEELSTMATIYNYPYYPQHLEKLGYRKESDWLEFLMEVPDRIPERYNRIADIVKEKFGLRVLKYKSRKRVKKEYGHALFHLINEDSAQKAQILTPLINWFQLHEGLTRKHACENLVYMVNELLIPYFASQARFMKSNHTGRLCWLNNLLKSAHGQHLLNDAARGGRQKREQAAQENRTNQRNNHPLSEFEWTDPESGMRFYDDVDEGTVNIPEEAQPRPSAKAIWNVLSNQWTTRN